MAKQKQSVVRVRSENLSWFDKLSPSRKDLVCLLSLFVLVLFLFNKIVFNNMMFADSGDTASAMSWHHAGTHIQETEHVDALWFPYVFSGMPSFGSLAFVPRNVNYLTTAIQWVGKYLLFGADWGWIVLHYYLMGVFMYLLVRQLKFSHIPSMLAAITLMLNPYAIGLAQSGHGSKLMALSYLPLVFLLTQSLFERRNLLSFGLLAAAVGTMLLTNHVQMIFYAFLVVGCYLVYEIVRDLKRQPILATKKGILFLLAFAIGFAISAYVYLSVLEYAQFSMRGGGGSDGGAGGLSYDYATNWSFHPLEIGRAHV